MTEGRLKLHIASQPAAVKTLRVSAPRRKGEIHYEKSDSHNLLRGCVPGRFPGTAALVAGLYGS